jgi:hypothetical protein
MFFLKFKIWKFCFIQGLRLYKNDWLLVWKLMVPHRDPSLLPRQWRVAMGTQKSYAKSEVTREKRRKYEANRRRKRALMADSKDVNTEEVIISFFFVCGLAILFC